MNWLRALAATVCADALAKENKHHKDPADNIRSPIISAYFVRAEYYGRKESSMPIVPFKEIMADAFNQLWQIAGKHDRVNL
jgi:hypothetical protein